MRFSKGDKVRVFWSGGGGRRWKKGWYEAEIVSYNEHSPRFPFMVKWSDGSQSKRTLQQVVPAHDGDPSADAPLVIPDRYDRAHQIRKVPGIYVISCEPLIEAGVLKLGQSVDISWRLSSYELAWPLWSITIFMILALPSKDVAEKEELRLHDWLRKNAHPFEGKWRTKETTELHLTLDLPVIKEHLNALYHKYRTVGAHFYTAPGGVFVVPPPKQPGEIAEIVGENRASDQYKVRWKDGTINFISRAFFGPLSNAEALLLWEAKKKGPSAYIHAIEKIDIAKEKRRGYDRERLADLQRAEDRYKENKVVRGQSHDSRAAIRELAFDIARAKGRNQPTAADFEDAKKLAI